MKTKTTIAALALALFASSPLAHADPPLPHQGDPNLCMSNPAYHRAHDADNKSKQCQGTAMNDYGGGGGMPDENGNGQDDRLESPAP